MEKSGRNKNEEEEESKKRVEQHKEWERRREVNKERAILERKCFVYRGFGHTAHNCRNMKNRREKRSMLMLSNKLLKNRVMNIEEGSGKKRKERKIIEKKD